MGFHIIISNAIAVAASIAAYIMFRKITQEEEVDESVGKVMEQQQQLVKDESVKQEEVDESVGKVMEQQQQLVKDERVSISFKEHYDQPQQEVSKQPIEKQPQQHVNYNLHINLPSELVDIIVRKLDVVTLCRWAAALPQHFHPILPTLTSLSMTVPSSLLLPPDKEALVHDLKRHIEMLDVDNAKLLHLLIIKPCLPIPRLLFMKRFLSLESLSVELPPPILVTDDYLTNPRVWFRWDSQFNINLKNRTHNLVYYYVSVHATIVKPQEEYHPIDVKTEGGRIRPVFFRHLKFHANTILSLFPTFYYSGLPEGGGKITNNPHPKLRTIVSKDMGMNGRLTLYSDQEEDAAYGSIIGERCTFSYLSEDLDLTTSSGSHNLKIRDAYLYFMYRGDVGNDARTKEDNDRILMSCLDRGDYPNEELKEAVTKILSHTNTRHLIQAY